MSARELRAWAIKALKNCQHGTDIEADHVDADKVLCDLLDELGYSDVVQEWRLVQKWYA